MNSVNFIKKLLNEEYIDPEEIFMLLVEELQEHSLEANLSDLIIRSTLGKERGNQKSSSLKT